MGQMMMKKEGLKEEKDDVAKGGQDGKKKVMR